MTSDAMLQLLVSGLVWGSLYALVTIGLNITYGTMRILNVAHGEFVMIGAYFSYWLTVSHKVNPLVNIVLVALAMALCGVLIHRLVVAPVLRSAKGDAGLVENATLLVFFGGILVLQNLALLLWTSDYRSLNYLSQSITIGSVSLALNRLVVMFGAVVLSIVIYQFIRRTPWGKALRAVSQDRTAASLMGIPVRSFDLMGFALGTALAGTAGTFLSMFYVITPHIGLGFMIKAFAVMVTAGLGNHLGVLLAGFGFGVAETVGGVLLGPSLRDVPAYGLLILAVLFRSSQAQLIRGDK